MKNTRKQNFRLQIFKTRIGFTLIELLVVVLIIGILSAIALPQYEKAVVKTRFANVMSLLASVKSAQEAHYLETSSYGKLGDLSLSFPLEHVYTNNAGNVECFHLKNEWIVLNFNSSTQQFMKAQYCKGHMSRTPEEGCTAAMGALFVIFYYDHAPSNPGRIGCRWENVPNGGKICATMCPSITGANSSSGTCWVR